MSVYAKAAVGAIIAGLSVLLTALTTGDQAVSAGEWVATAIATLTALGVIYQTPNRAASSSDAGYTLVEMAFALLIVVIVLVVLFHFL